MPSSQRYISIFLLSTSLFTYPINLYCRERMLLKRIARLTKPHSTDDYERLLLSTTFRMLSRAAIFHSYSAENKTIVALRLVKDFIIERGGVEEIKVSKEMLRSCDRAKERYSIFLRVKINHTVQCIDGCDNVCKERD